MRELLVIFATVFVAELGDKTQLVTLMFASNAKNSAWLVFFAAALALIACTAVNVALGTMAERYLTMIPLKLIAGIGFILIGAWTVFAHFRGS